MKHFLRSTRSREILAAIVALVVIVFAVQEFTGYLDERPDGDRYQAVFLTNGNVYVGKLSGIGGSFVKLKDVYFFQSGGASPSPRPGAEPGDNLSLARLDQNKLIHPDPEMTISKSSILFWENMQDDAEVVKRIQQQKSGE